MLAKQNEIVSIILAAGKSSRMQAPDKAKVCFPVAGKPAIIRALETYRKAGINSHVIVVGYHAEEVMRTVSEKFDGEVWFAFQPKALGTGNAAKCGAQLLQKIGYDGSILLVAGDKVIKPGVIERLVRVYKENRAGLAFMSAEKEVEPTAGRLIFSPDGRPIASIEKFDSGKSRLLAMYFGETEKGGILEADRAIALAREFIGPDKKLALALGGLFDDLKGGPPLTRERLQHFFSPNDRLISIGDGKHITGAEVEKSRYVNLSVYLFKAQALYYALTKLTTQNAQKEEYLTDAISILNAAGKYHLVSEKVVSKDEILAFNAPEELRQIEELYAEQENHSITGGAEINSRFRSATQWLDMISSISGDLKNTLTKIYGPDYNYVAEKNELLKDGVLKFYQRFGEGPVIVSRAPARVNLMGRHIDHQGGFCNTVGIDLDIIVITRPRMDRMLRLSHVDAKKHPDCDLEPDDFESILHKQNWQRFIASQRTHNFLKKRRGDWSHYILAIFLRLQKHFPDIALKGMDMTVTGNIPQAAGLGSSSALTVAVAEAIARINRLPIEREALVTVCSEAEWFVGVRGGAADQAAILFARRNAVLPLRLYPFVRENPVDWPGEVSLMIVNSGRKAEKSKEARVFFNQRVACYRFGLDWLLKSHPELAAHIKHLRDLKPDHLKMPLADFYKLLKSLPENIDGQDIGSRIPVDWSAVMPDCPNAEKYLYAIRNTVVYGIAECARSEKFRTLLSANELAEIGELMSISHDGDRVAHTENGSIRPFRIHYNDDYLDELIAQAKRNASSCALHLEPGAYGCSTPEIDTLVDLAQSVDGVLGAQIAGAGLGGSLMIL
ncbi:MAG: galactokinase family protein, partial [bacterium]